MKTLAKLLLGLVASLIAAMLILIGIDAAYTPACSVRPAPGTTIAIPGETMVVMEPVMTSAGETLVLDVVRDPFDIPDYTLPPEHGHIHPNQEERFEVVSGRARFLIGDEYIELGPGEVGIVPANTVHHWMALDDQPVRVTTYFEPVLDVDMWFLHFQKYLAADEMNLFLAAVISREYPGGAPMPVSPPPAVWAVLSRVLAPVGRLLGYEAC